MSESTIESLTELLHTRGERMTPARAAVLGVLEANAGHLSAEQVVEEVARSAPEVHRASVHRTLELLTRLHLVQHVHPSHGPTLYHLTGDHGHEHVHAQCRHCGRIIDLSSDALDSLAADLLATSGFELHIGHATLSGVCGDCRASAR